MKAKYFIFFLFCGIYSVTSAAPSSKSLSGWTLGVGLLYPANGRSFEGSGKRSSTNASIKSDFEFASQPSYYGFLKFSKENSLGFTLGYEALQESDLTGGNINLGGTSIPATTYSLLDSVHINVAHIGTEYRFRQFYVPIEILFVDPKFKMKTGTVGHKAGVGTGYLVGAGYHLFRNMSMELNYRSIGFSFGEFLSTGANPPYDDYGTITSNEIILSMLFHL